MLKSSLLDRLAQPRSLAAIFAVIMAFVAITSIPAEARRHGYRQHASYGRHVYARHFAHHRGYVRHARSHRFYASTRSTVASEAGRDDIVGEHRGFAAIVVDGNSGRTLYARNEHELRHPASVTKVMTLYLLFEQLEKGRLRLDSPLMISAHAAAQAPSKLGLRPGETISVENAIKALVTKSANDIACAVAENIGGDEHSFAQMMTRKARALGMRNTHYENASGLPDPRQITTAYDLAVLGRAVQDRFPRYYRYFSTHSFAYNGALHRNHNHLLGRVEGMDGIKTGYTRASGFNLLTSVRRGSHHIVAVVMGGATAGGRDQIMAGLIENHIGGGASVRTAAAITEDSAAEEVAEETVSERPVERQMVAERRVVAEPQAVAAPPVEPSPEPIVERPAERQPTRVAYAAEPEVDTEEVGALAPARPLRRADAPVPPAPIPAKEKVAERVEKAERPDKAEKTAAVRPAFVSGVQKRVAEEPVADKKGRAKGLAKQDLAAIIDGSTSSRTKAREITVATTTPSAIRSSANNSQVAKADPARPSKPGWMIQIGAAEDPDKANQLLSRARSQLQGFPPSARAFTEKVQKGKETLYRARFAGLEEQSAVSACNALKRSGFSCFTTKN